MNPAEESLARHRALVAAMEAPACYPHPVDHVEHRDTHISSVLLAGDYAYKLKKPVDLGFVDFSTLQRRQHFCREELRLNARFAPDLYLGVVDIAGPPERPRIGGPGPLLEPAVRMHRFPQDALLSAQLAAGQLSGARIDSLAAALAAMHDEAPVATAGEPWGTPDAVLAPALENLRTLEPAPAGLPGAELAAVDRYTRETGAALMPAFRERRAQGHFRECHGDLHLDNLLWWRDRVQAFDAIEFSPALRWIDTASDLAFTLMDLEFRGAPRLARRLLSAYLERTGDYAALQVLGFYRVYRAMVRAKVAALQGKPEAAGYLALAEVRTHPGRPALVLTHGLSGSGKSRAALALVEAFGCIRLRSDVERKRLLGLAAQQRTGSGLEQGAYTPDMSRRTYRRLAALADAALAGGYSVVVDAAALKAWQRREILSVGRRREVPCAVLALEAPREELERRLRRRAAKGRDASEADLSVLRHQLGELEPVRQADHPEVAVFRPAGGADATEDALSAWFARI